MRGWLSGGGGLVVILAMAGCANSGLTTTSAPAEVPTTTSTTSSERSTSGNSAGPEAQSVSRTKPAEFSVSDPCAREIRAGAHTSCQFAEKVAQQFADLQTAAGYPPGVLKAFSPVSHREYNLRCVLLGDRHTAECATG